MTASHPGSARGARDHSRKIRSRADALAWRRALSGRLAFTNGVFDVLHRGHVALLQAARAEADALLVGLNSDDSTRRLKGPGRPVVPAADRAFVLAALEPVDCVVVFEEDTPLELIRMLEPDVLVKGADYGPEAIVGADVVMARGGRVVRVPLEAGVSTSAILERVRGG